MAASSIPAFREYQGSETSGSDQKDQTQTDDREKKKSSGEKTKRGNEEELRKCVVNVGTQ